MYSDGAPGIVSSRVRKIIGYSPSSCFSSLGRVRSEDHADEVLSTLERTAEFQLFARGIDIGSIAFIASANRPRSIVINS